MSTEQTLQIMSLSLEQSLSLAASIGAKLKGSELIALQSDVGGGKTTFVRGLARGMGSMDIVSSPSFTVSNQYSAGSLTLYHFDFYRLHEPGIVQLELAEVIADPLAVIAVEWGNIVANTLPVEHIRVAITPTGELSRLFEITYPERYAYCLAGLGS